MLNYEDRGEEWSSYGSGYLSEFGGSGGPIVTAGLPPGRQDHDFFSPDSGGPQGRHFDRDGDKSTTLRQGDRDGGIGPFGRPIRMWQTNLNRWLVKNWDRDRGAAHQLQLTGGFDGTTARATRSFQAAHGLPTSGVVDPATKAAMTGWIEKHPTPRPVARGPFTPTPHSAGYNALMPYPESYVDGASLLAPGYADLGLGPMPSKAQDEEGWRQWTEERNRRSKANRDALAAIRLQAEAGERQPCDDLALLYQENELRSSEHMRHNPLLYITSGMAIPPSVPAACTAPLFEPPEAPLVQETDPLRMETVTHRLEAAPRAAPTGGLKPVYVAAGLGILALAIFGGR